MLPTFVKVSVEPTVINSLLFLNVFPININKYVLFLYNSQYQQVSQNKLFETNFRYQFIVNIGMKKELAITRI